MSNKIIFPFVLYVNDYHEFIHIEKFLHAIGIDCKYRELNDEPYSALFYSDESDKYPENFIDVKAIKL